jgi:kinesin family protein 6/9
MLKNLGLIKVENEQQALDLLITGNYIRHIGSTTMNNASSRSHAIFNIIIESNDNNLIRVSKLNLVDLAGSERIKSTNNNTSIERKYINLSLSFLEQVIIALNSKDRTHIPYRNSLMTTILKDSLGGNCKTILIATISSNINYIEESISSIRFSVRCSKVTNNVSINECMDLNVLVNKLIGENERLKKLLNEKGINDSNDKNCLVLNPNPLNDYEKDECKILISEYLNNNKKEPIKAKNVNQLYYIIDFLIEYIDKKETKYNSKMKEIVEEKKKLKIIEEKENEKFKKINEIIKKNGLKKYFQEFFDDENNNNN